VSIEQSRPTTPRVAIPARAGVGLRFTHHREVIARRPGVAWFEVHTENYFGGGAALAALEAVRRDYPVALHGTGLSLGSADGLDRAHVGRLAALAARIEPGIVSEHLAWSTIEGRYFGDLLPLPLTEESLDVVCANVDEAQEALRRPILLENPSTYLRFTHSTIAECEFLAAVAARTGCGILCDVNNVYVSACNHGFDPLAYLAALPGGAVGEFHLAGHALRALPDGGALRIDDHGSRVPGPVWTLFEAALARFGARPTLVEWDTNVPSLDVLIEEAALADSAVACAREAALAVAA
jgi:uncharacterized protein (UPF0276 family)